MGRNSPRFIGATACLAVLLTGCVQTRALKNGEGPKVPVVMDAGPIPPVRRIVNVPVEAKFRGVSVVAPCTAKTIYYSATFSAPANLQIPDMGNRSPDLEVSCVSELGRGTLISAAQNVEQNRAKAVGGAVFGVIGAVAAGVVANDVDLDHFYYSMNVRLK